MNTLGFLPMFSTHFVRYFRERCVDYVIFIWLRLFWLLFLASIILLQIVHRYEWFWITFFIRSSFLDSGLLIGYSILVLIYIISLIIVFNINFIRSVLHLEVHFFYINLYGRSFHVVPISIIGG